MLTGKKNGQRTIHIMSNKVARLGFDILEVGAAPLPDYTKEQIQALRDCAKANNIELTAGLRPGI